MEYVLIALAIILISLLFLLLLYPNPLCKLLNKLKLYDALYFIKIVFFKFRRTKINENNKFFSVDDCIDCFYDLYKNDYNDIFESKYFKLFKEIHDKYNVDIHLFIMYKNNDFDLSMLSSKYKEQFINNPWLKFGFHSLDINSNYNEQSIINDYKLIKESIIRIASIESFSNYLRIHGYKGSYDEIKKICNDDNLTLILADDYRKCYGRYFNKQYISDVLFDENIKIICSSIRLERVRFRFILNFFKNTHQVYDVFTHEKFLNQKNINKLNKIFK